MDPFLAIGQIIVSIALIAAVLLQARGTGLSSTFGGDSAVYRSRRGVERRLWQFTIILLILFVLFSLASLHLRAGRLSRRAGQPPVVSGPAAARSMNRIDHAVIGALVLVLAVIAVGDRRARASSRPRRPRRRRPSVEPAMPYSEGDARTAGLRQPARRPHPGRPRPRRADVFGLVKLGPDGMLIPDLASRWTTDETGKAWTFRLRPEARWHDGEPLTARRRRVHDRRPP